MRPSELKALIASRIKAGIKRPLYIEGSPGLGKTQIAAQVARDLGIDFKAVHLPTLLLEDLGIPVVSEDRTDVRFVVSKDRFPIEGSPCGEVGLLLIDEMGAGDPAIQKGMANLIQEREIHGHRLKAGWIIVATGNRLADRAGANRILSHLANRMTRVPMDASLDDWTSWALANSVRHEVIAFLRFRPGLLNSFDPQAEVNATPRAWVEGVSAGLGVIPAESELACFSGDVGAGPASEFLAFLKIFRKLPNPDAILLAPEKAEVPSDPATRYALVGALSMRVTATNFGRALTYVKRMSPEFTVLFVRDAILRCDDVQRTAEFVAWITGEGKGLLT